jgi:hypothetical protein
LCGETYGHPRFANGARITSSPIAALRADLVVTRLGTLYELGKVNRNAMLDAFTENREFAYLVLLLCLLLTQDLKIPPIPAACAPGPASVLSIVAYAALALNNGNSTIQ